MTRPAFEASPARWARGIVRAAGAIGVGLAVAASPTSAAPITSHVVGCVGDVCTFAPDGGPVSVSFHPAAARVVPEPETLALMGMGAAALVRTVGSTRTPRRKGDGDRRRCPLTPVRGDELAGPVRRSPDAHALGRREVQRLARLHVEGLVPGVEVAHDGGAVLGRARGRRSPRAWRSAGSRNLDCQLCA